jgi:hypothetical protein
MIQARISLSAGWGERMARQLEGKARAALPDAAKQGARVASSAAQARRRTGRMAQMELLPVERTPRGFSCGFRSQAWYAGFQSEGTLGSRRRQVKVSTLRRRQSASGQARLAKVGGSGGISALGFLEKGRTAMRRSFVERMNRI